jgi:hypothetical protein
MSYASDGTWEFRRRRLGLRIIKASDSEGRGSSSMSDESCSSLDSSEGWKSISFHSGCRNVKGGGVLVTRGTVSGLRVESSLIVSYCGGVNTFGSLGSHRMEEINIFGLGSDFGEIKEVLYGGVEFSPFVKEFGDPKSFQEGELLNVKGELC